MKLEAGKVAVVTGAASGIGLALATRFAQDGLKQSARERDPAAVADVVAEAIAADRFWIPPHPEWVERAARRWSRIAEGLDPDPADHVPGFPPATQIASEIRAVLTAAPIG